MFLPQEIIRRKRDGEELKAEEISFFIDALTSGRVTEGQTAAFAMAVYFQGMSARESALLTCAMRDSGRVLQWSSEFLGGPVLDKHSTGGVGDNVSLILAPAVAACGGFVPMISGRSLGHTGGTLDKLDSIPGYLSTPDSARFRHCVQTVGCAIIGQTADLAPADKKLYALRDVTATVECIPLICGSILSKKLAEGIDTLVATGWTTVRMLDHVAARGVGTEAQRQNVHVQLARRQHHLAQGHGGSQHQALTRRQRQLTLHHQQPQTVHLLWRRGEQHAWTLRWTLATRIHRRNGLTQDGLQRFCEQVFLVNRDLTTHPGHAHHATQRRH